MIADMAGASTFDVEHYEHLASHAKHENETLMEYQRVVATSPLPIIRYLANLILEDEVRHHRLFDELAESVKRSSTLFGEEGPIPRLDEQKRPDSEVLAVTQRLLGIEEGDARELKRLRKELKDYDDTAAWTRFAGAMAAALGATAAAAER